MNGLKLTSEEEVAYNCYIIPRSRTNNIQINIAVFDEWKKELENLARIYSVEEGKTITFLDLMRRGIQEKYQLKDVNDHEE